MPVSIILAGPALMLLCVQGRGWEPPWILGSVALALTASIAIATLVERTLDRVRVAREAPVMPAGPTREQLEQWRVSLRAEVARLRTRDGGQLGKMVRQGDPIDVNVERLDRDARRSRVRVDERVLPWSEITRRWDTARSRLVVLGDPGYGKTVAALALIKHINTCDEPGASVAELFSLSEWQRWRGEHPDAPFSHWLAEQLTVVYPSVSAEVARALVDVPLILPVLDGLDEIAAVEHRRACVEAIDAYAERGAPHRAFVLTCRAREYRELAPDGVRDDECVELVGLQPDQIQQRLHEQATRRPRWEAVRDRQAVDSSLNELFASPLRLAIALQVYRDRDPSDLLNLTLEQARERLWKLLLETNADTYPGASAGQVHSWLAFLAAGMKRTAHQRLMLHELYRIDPDPTATLRPLLMILGLTAGLVAGLLFGVGGKPVLGLLVGVAVAWLVARPHGEVPNLVSAPPTTQAHVGWRNRVRAALRRDMLVLVLVGGGLVGLAFGLAGGLSAGVSGALGAGWMIAFTGGFAEGTEVVKGAPPSRFAHAHPDAVLIASRNSGLINGLIIGLPAGLGILLALEPIFDRIGVGGRLFVVLGTVLYALQWALLTGLNAWVYHHWLRWRLRARGLLPARLPALLEWCARDDRGWLRITDAYEFRHRELLEHLAARTAGVHACGASSDADGRPSRR